jgi:PTH1 family peptidyl-tRNA hydrolase
MNKIKIKLIVGLGNPGKEYENIRHNAGFLFVDALARQLKIKNFEHKKNLFSEIAEAEIPISKSQIPNKFKILLAKPQIFINKSGEAVLALSKFFKIKPENILIVHDDIDILWGNYKFSFGRSSAGHKGVESVIKALKTKNFWRLRIGIQPRLAASNKRQATRIKADKLVLKKFTPAELKTLNQTIKKALAEINDF